MLELTIYGLMGLAVLLVVALYFAFEDEFSLAPENPSMGGPAGEQSGTGFKTEPTGKVAFAAGPTFPGGSGTVTNVANGGGLTGGPTTKGGTLGIATAGATSSRSIFKHTLARCVFPSVAAGDVGTAQFGYGSGFAQDVPDRPNAFAFAFHAPGTAPLVGIDGSIEMVYADTIAAHGTKTP
jgi:hypothetical protein